MDGLQELREFLHIRWYRKLLGAWRRFIWSFRGPHHTFDIGDTVEVEGNFFKVVKRTRTSVELDSGATLTVNNEGRQ